MGLTMKFLAAILTLGALATPSFASDRDELACPPESAVNTLLEAAGYSDVRMLGKQGGVTFFDARRGKRSWFRMGIDSCTGDIRVELREAGPRI